MTSEEFFAFYPQFEGVFPVAVLDAVISSANSRFTDFLEDTDEARRLFTAHKLTLYAKSAPPPAAPGESVSYAALAGAGDGTRVASKRVDDVSVTYASSAGSASASFGLADLEETLFGRQLLLLLRLHAWPRYIP